MNCSGTKELLPGYVDGLLGPEDAAAVKEHLAGCAECARAVAELEKTIALVRDIEEVDPPPWLRQKIMAQIREEHARKGATLFDRLFRPFHVKLPIQAVAAVLVCVIAWQVADSLKDRDESGQVNRFAKLVENRAGGDLTPEYKKAQADRSGKDRKTLFGAGLSKYAPATQPPPPHRHDAVVMQHPSMMYPACQPSEERPEYTRHREQSSSEALAFLETPGDFESYWVPPYPPEGTAVAVKDEDRVIVAMRHEEPASGEKGAGPSGFVIPAKRAKKAESPITLAEAPAAAPATRAFAAAASAPEATAADQAQKAGPALAGVNVTVYLGKDELEPAAESLEDLFRKHGAVVTSRQSSPGINSYTVVMKARVLAALNDWLSKKGDVKSSLPSSKKPPESDVTVLITLVRK
ncbi:MAG: DUF2275 domain-containing protein [Myxococcota bacterium]|jgi:hypothetical protein